MLLLWLPSSVALTGAKPAGAGRGRSFNWPNCQHTPGTAATPVGSIEIYCRAAACQLCFGFCFLCRPLRTSQWQAIRQLFNLQREFPARLDRTWPGQESENSLSIFGGKQADSCGKLWTRTGQHKMRAKMSFAIQCEYGLITTRKMGNWRSLLILGELGN